MADALTELGIGLVLVSPSDDLGADPRLHHGIEVVDGVRADESATLLKEFFAARRLQ